MVKKEESSESKTSLRKRFFWVAFFILLFFFLVFLLSNLYLSYNYLLGNDVIVQVGPDQNHFSLYNNETISVSFESSIVANPFCRVKCSSSFVDLSSDVIISSQNKSFLLRSFDSFSENFTLSAPSIGNGQKLYRYDLECNGVSSPFCYTSSKIARRTIPVTMDYDFSPKDKSFQEKLIQNYTLLSSRMLILQNNVESLNLSLSEFPFLFFKNISNETANLVFATDDLQSEFISFKNSWNDHSLSYLNSLLFTLSRELFILENVYLHQSASVNRSLLQYDSLASSVNEVGYFLESASGEFYLDNITTELYILENNYALYYSRLNSFDSLPDAVAAFNPIYQKYLLINSELNGTKQSEDALSLFSLSDNVSFLDSFHISSDFVSLDYTLPSEGVCCINGVCGTCCDYKCQRESHNYPVIFLHGHDFSESISPQYNLNIFSDIQHNLEVGSGIYDFGSFLINEPSFVNSGIWGRIDIPLSIRSSYYFETVRSQNDLSILQAKKDNIDTYAVRLHYLVLSVLKKTGKQKVVIVTHSMGGLVARRYMQIFGDSAVSSVVFIGTPHDGIRGDVERYCGFFGSEIECSEMRSGSLFLQKLQTAPVPNVSAYNLIGVGCNMNGKQGDGIVLNESAYISWAQNYFVNGSCDSFSFDVLHSELLNTERYPETLDILRGVLNFSQG